MCPALSLEQLPAQKQCRQIPGVEHQRALNRVFFAGFVAQVLAGKSEIDPLLGVRAIGVDKALERRAGGSQVALEKCALPERGQGSRVARINLKNSAPQPVSIFMPPRTYGSRRFRFEGIDFLKIRVGVLHRVVRSPGRPGFTR
jgi:hypothetical protein